MISTEFIYSSLFTAKLKTMNLKVTFNSIWFTSITAKKYKLERSTYVPSTKSNVDVSCLLISDRIILASVYKLAAYEV